MTTVIKYTYIGFFLTLTQFAYADPWDVFDDFDEEEESESNLSMDRRITLLTSAGYNFDNHSKLNPNDEIYTVDRWKVRYFTQFEGTIRTLDNRYLVKSNFSLNISNNGVKNFVNLLQRSTAAEIVEETHKGYDSRMAFMQLDIRDLYFRYLAINDIHIMIGVMNLNIGEHFVLNPVNYFNKYYAYPEDYQDEVVYPFPCVKINYPTSLYTVSFAYIPGFIYPDGLKEYFRYKDFSHILMLQNSWFIFDATMSLYLFHAFGEQNVDDTLMGGIGVETSYHLTPWMNISAQIMYSDGSEKAKVVETGDYPTIKMDEAARVFRFEGLLKSSISIFEGTDLSISYYYNQGGYTRYQSSKLVKNLKLYEALDAEINTENELNTSYSTYLYSYLKIYDPLKLKQNYLLLSFVKTDMDDRFNLNFTPFICIDDGSMLLYAHAQLNLTDSLVLSAQGKYFLGRDYSAFGFNFYRGDVSIKLVYFM